MEWVEIQKDKFVITYAANVPGGAIVRCTQATGNRGATNDMVFVPGAKVVNHAKKLIQRSEFTLGKD